MLPVAQPLKCSISFEVIKTNLKLVMEPIILSDFMFITSYYQGIHYYIITENKIYEENLTYNIQSINSLEHL